MLFCGSLLASYLISLAQTADRVKPKSSVCDCRTLISCSIPRSSSELFQPLKYYSPVEEEGRWRRRRREVNSVSFQPTPLFLVHLLLFLWFVSGASLFPLRQRLNYGRHWLSVCTMPFHFLDLNAYQQVQAVPHRPGSVLTTVDPLHRASLATGGGRQPHSVNAAW